MRALTYVLPLKWPADANLDEMTGYLRRLAGAVEVIVIDNSSPEAFERHARAWGDVTIHRRPDERFRFANGKVNNVLTGVFLASNDAVVIADDDVRYDERALDRVEKLLQTADLVIPQNYFDALPWHALWDTARTLINRSFWHDFPGTLAVRAHVLRRAGGYDGDVLFENLELIRTYRAAGASVVVAPDLYLPRTPPTTRRFLGQRVRQAYDEFARPALLATWLSILPLATLLALTQRRLALAGLALAPIALAELGRRRNGGRRVFPARATLFAPLWVLERAVCSWAAVGARVLRGGITYADRVIVRAATPSRELTHR